MTIYDPTDEFDDGEQSSLGDFIEQAGGNARDAIDGNAAKIQEAFMRSGKSDDELVRELDDRISEHVGEANAADTEYGRRYNREAARQIKELADELDDGMRRTSVRGMAAGRLNRAEREISEATENERGRIADAKGLRTAARTVIDVLEDYI